MPEREMWQAKVIRHLLDALYEPRRGKRGHPKNAGSAPTPLDTQRAQSWLTGNGRNFRDTCEAAGFDPDFVRDAYLSGRITLDTLKGADLDGMVERLTRNPAAPENGPPSAPDAPRRPDIAETATRAPAPVFGPLRACTPSPRRKP